MEKSIENKPTYPFRWKKLKKLAEGYGNRFGLFCNTCNKRIMEFDYGNLSGLHLGYKWATEEAMAHKKHCK